MKFSAEEMIKAIRTSGGILAHAARALGCSRSTVNRYCDKYPTVKAAMDDAREEMLDLAESELVKLIKEGNITAIIFTLKTLGKSRGWTEKHILEHSGGVDGVTTGVLKIGPPLSLEEWVEAAANTPKFPPLLDEEKADEEEN